MVLSFNKLTVEKDQEFRSEIRATGAKYGVIKNTLARLAVKGTPFEEVTDHFNGVTSVAWADGEPIDLSKVISKYVKEEKGVFEFKTGIIDGKVIAFSDVEQIASLPSREELIGKLLYLINSPAQRLATVLSAIPRDLAAVVRQVSERSDDTPAAEAGVAEVPTEQAPKAGEAPKEEAPKEVAKQAEASKDEAPEEEAPKEEAPQAEASSGEALKEEAPKEQADEKVTESADAPADGKKKDAESSKKEDKPVKDDAAADKGEADKESDSEQEGGDEPAGDESK